MKTQQFNGKTYYLYPNERYYSKGVKRLHRVVWEHHKGEIPEGYHIHHIDNNPENNSIDNLAMVHESLHGRLTSIKRGITGNSDFNKDALSKAREAAKEWHKSEEGLKWHSTHGKKTWINRKSFTKECQQCGKEYKTYFPERSKFCHNNCKAKALRARRRNETYKQGNP